MANSLNSRFSDLRTIAITEKCCGDHVAAGFMPAFKLQPEIVLVIKRGHKARGYVPVLTTHRFDEPRIFGSFS